MRFVKAKDIRPGNVVLFSGDDVDELWAYVVGVKRMGMHRLKFTYYFYKSPRVKSEQSTEIRYCENRCLFIKRFPLHSEVRS